MMLYPSTDQLVDEDTSRYYLVTVVARRARDIVDRALEKGEAVPGKPVQLAINEMLETHIKVREGHNLSRELDEAEEVMEKAAEDQTDDSGD